MSTLSATVEFLSQRNPNSTIKYLFILLFIFTLIVIPISISYSEHAVVKHGEDATIVRQCMNEKGPIEIWQKPDGRLVNLCQINETKFGIMITEGKFEVTSYIKEKMTRLSQVRKYIESMGAKQLR